MTEHWKPTPEAHDFPAAYNFLRLGFDDEHAARLVERLKAAPDGLTFYAKDLLRASRLPLLDESNKHVARDLEKIRGHDHLSPVLLIRGDEDRGLALVIADGYHRVCASYWVDENSPIPCRMVDRS